MNYFNQFATEAAYNSAAPSLTLPGVSLVDGVEVKYDQKFNFDPKYLYEDLTTSKVLNGSKRVIGIEVVPALHTPNKKARYMSIKNMSHVDPENGTSAKGNAEWDSENETGNPGTMIPWGNYNEPISDPRLPATGENYPKALDTDEEEITETNPGGLIDSLSSENTGYYIPGDTDELEFLGGEYPFEPAGRYLYNEEGYSVILPYPFLRTGRRNPKFAQSGTWMVEMDGRVNTKALIDRLSGNSWKTGELDLEVGDGSQEGAVIKHPAAVACHRFNAGISGLSGKWYLPAMGELAYLWANIAKINEKLDAIKAADGAVCVGMGDSSEFPCWGDTAETTGLGDWLWSSSVYDDGNAWGLSTDSGTANYYNRHDRGTSLRVRAFFQQ